MKIVGVPVGTTMPRANLNQTNPKKADYVLGREELFAMLGDLSDLNTEDKKSLVAAINELLEKNVSIASIETKQVDGVNGTVVQINMTDGTGCLFTVNNGSDGKSPYDYAVEAGYEGTEEEFAEQMADPFATTITDDGDGNVVVSALGAVDASDDGEGNVEVSAASLLPDTAIPTKVSQLENDAGYLTDLQTETWIFELEDGATATKQVVVK